MTSWWGIVPVMLGAIVPIPVGRLTSARADEQRTFCGRTLDGWVEVLRHGTARERTDAGWMLSYFGPEARKAVPDLIDCLRRARDVRHEPGAVRALGRIGPDAAPAVPLLIPGYLADGCNLAKMGTFLGGNGGMPAEALVGIGAPAVPALINILTGPNTEMRACAAMHLADIGPAAKAAVPVLVRLLRANKPDPDDAEAGALRRYAIVALGRIGPEAREAVPVLNALLDVSYEGVIVDALDRLGEPPVAAFVDAFRRGGDCYGLARLGPKARSAIPSLRKALTDPRPVVRIEAAIALTSIDPPAPDAVRVLTADLARGEEEAYDAPEALGRLGPAASAALPVLIGLVEKGAGAGVVEALVRIDPEGKVCIPALITALKSQAPGDLYAAARAIGLLGPRARQAVPALAEVLGRNFREAFGNEGDPLVDAAKALGRIGPQSRSAIPALMKAVKSRHVVPSGRLFARDEEEVDYDGAATATRVLGTLGPEAKAAVPALIDVLRDQVKRDDKWEVRREAALTLGRIGPGAREAIPVLRKVVEEGPPPELGRRMIPMQVSDAAVVALFYLVPDGEELAERWAERSTGPDRKATLLGAIGRTSYEAELLSRIWVDDLNGVLAQAELEGDETLFVEGYFERLGLLGVGAKAAIPRLIELARHRNPWIRQWAGETLERITKAKTGSAGP